MRTFSWRSSTTLVSKRNVLLRLITKAHLQKAPNTAFVRRSNIFSSLLIKCSSPLSSVECPRYTWNFWIYFLPKRWSLNMEMLRWFLFMNGGFEELSSSKYLMDRLFLRPNLLRLLPRNDDWGCWKMLKQINVERVERSTENTINVRSHELLGSMGRFKQKCGFLEQRTICFISVLTFVTQGNFYSITIIYKSSMINVDRVSK